MHPLHALSFCARSQSSLQYLALHTHTQNKSQAQAGRKKGLGRRDALDDLVMLDKPDEQSILKTLNNRYAMDFIYTNIGPVLVAVNPFKMISELYTEANLNECRAVRLLFW
jgi:myosin heavy subunit